MTEINAFAEGREGDVTKLLREVNGWTDALNRTLEELAQERLEGMDGTGAVRARVSGAGGRLLGLTIDPRTMRNLDHVELAQAVMEAVTAARAAMGDRLTEFTTGLGVPAAPESGADPLAPHVQRVLREG
ncbi:YbaB/EbfC family nucleoid-associated protein [Nonomuraea basaltis]|uniref:YbaB/EbfC family nucleoid-associated protein n=1 Tax=Nonomuraea basaltis TaxID=2495887 RepID=UPI00110C5696|nr:YbaB/EbfC family nucleoid-associated protein [Nonomuraea basaltis]TMR96940.1 YbaB/EbfC family nucleoid-associated protein [Nonomuraea basaltis]